MENNLILGLDISTKTIGVALFENIEGKPKLKLLTHVTPKVKPQPSSKIQELCDKANIFEEEFLNKYIGMGITKVVIEEPLLRSNNVNTVATLLRFNGMLSRSVYNILGLVPEYISSYNARAFAFPELMEVRKINKKGEPYSEKEISNKKPVLFGGYDFTVDKKMVIWEKIADLEPQIKWLYTNKGTLRKENFDMTDSYAACLGYMHKEGIWLPTKT
jgi:RNase H-fold protein (predicted Holliday junction resolvase)